LTPPWALEAGAAEPMDAGVAETETAASARTEKISLVNCIVSMVGCGCDCDCVDYAKGGEEG
jgi:hypothetical protein